MRFSIRRSAEAQAAELGLDLVVEGAPSAARPTKHSLLRESVIRALGRQTNTAVVSFGRRLVALELGQEWLALNDRDREQRKGAKLLVPCAAVETVEVGEIVVGWAKCRLTARPLVLRCGRAPLSTLERLVARNARALEDMEPCDEDYGRSIVVFALPDLATPRLVSGFRRGYDDGSLRAASRRHGFDRWRPRSRSEDAAFWKAACGLDLPTPVGDSSHVLLRGRQGPCFAPLPRELVVGETVVVPAASRTHATRIVEALVRALQSIPGLANAASDDSPACPRDNDDDKENQTLASDIELFRSLLQERHDERRREAEEAAAAKKRMKIERRMARQKERERREQLRKRIDDADDEPPSYREPSRTRDQPATQPERHRATVAPTTVVQQDEAVTTADDRATLQRATIAPTTIAPQGEAVDTADDRAIVQREHVCEEPQNAAQAADDQATVQHTPTVDLAQSQPVREEAQRAEHATDVPATVHHATTQDDVDARQKEHAKLERKLARQRERERRAKLRAAAAEQMPTGCAQPMDKDASGETPRHNAANV